MNKNVIIEVRQDHINKGVRQNTYSCPIGLAVRERFPDWGGLSVDEYTISYGYFSVKAYPLSFKAYSFVKNFDEGRPVKPFKFKIKINE